MTAYAFTGPHTVGDEFRPYVRECLQMLDAPTTVITGCAFGIDTLVAKEAIDLFPAAHHVLVLPEGLHNAMVVERFEALSTADARSIEIVTVYPRSLADPYRGRNEEMVRRCEVLVAFPNTYRYERSGTWMTINIAKRARRGLLMFPLDNAVLLKEG